VRRVNTRSLFLPLLCLGACVSAEPDEDTRPNVLLILVDDLGLECLSEYGGTSYATPHIDQLAAGGMRFDYAFCTPVCTPSRVELMTGLYPFRTGWDVGIWTRNYEERLVDPALPSIGRVMQAAGYATAVAGKWQLCHFERSPDHAEELGFDEYCLWTYRLQSQGAVDHRFWKPSVWESGAKDTEVERDELYGPDLYCDFLIDFIERHQDQPWFAYYPMALVHRPYTATPDTVLDVAATLAEAPEKAEDSLERFGDNVAYMDRIVGRLTAALERLELRDETLILFTADNGTDARITSLVGTLAVRGGKTQLTELGAAVPLIASWPGVIQPGTVNADLIDFTDILPTLADVAGSRAPDGGDGRSFVPQLRGERGHPRDWIYVQLEGHWYIRDRNWRLHDDGRMFDVRDRFREREITERRATPSDREASRRLSATASQLLLGR